MLERYDGNLGLDTGRPQSVYQLNPRQVALGRLKKVGQPMMLWIGDVQRFADGSAVEFLGTRAWITVSVRYDPGEVTMLAAAAALIVGLAASLHTRRRRVWLRITADGTVTAGGLPRGNQPRFAAEFADIIHDVHHPTVRRQ